MEKAELTAEYHSGKVNIPALATTADTAGNTANADLNIDKDTQSDVTVNVGDDAVINAA